MAYLFCSVYRRVSDCESQDRLCGLFVLCTGVCVCVRLCVIGKVM